MGRRWAMWLGLAAMIWAAGCRGGVDVNEREDRARFTADAGKRIAEMEIQIRAVREEARRFDEHVQVAARSAADAAEAQLQEARASFKGLHEAPRGGSRPFKEAINAYLDNARALLEQAEKDVRKAAGAVENSLPPS